ncbi:MAG: hypothetical protein R3293_18425 [Candidatus Promineifilaceae bacterium]|nr:hypothetical protein [Candidatus Promineifilaceae bacterium]
MNQIYRLEKDEIQELLEFDESIKVTFTMPIQQEVDKRDENRIRLKNLLQDAEQMLIALEFRTPVIEDLLAPANQLIGGTRFLDLSSPGLALFLAEGVFYLFQLPFEVAETVVAAPNFQIKSLMPLRNVGAYYILNLSQNNVRLLYATEHTSERVNISDMPQSLDEALRWDDPESQLQWHSQTGQTGNGRAAMFHGHGGANKETHKQDLLRYFQLLDQGISRILVNETAPLILSGVDYLLPIYRQANSYQYLLDQDLTGSQEHLSDAEIHQKTWPLVQEHFREERNTAVSRYHQMAAQELATANLEAVLTAAYQGRVDTLFVATDRQIWGSYDPQTGRAQQNDEWQPGDGDLLNLATILTVKYDGDVFAGPQDKMHTEEPLAAIFRF